MNTGGTVSDSLPVLLGHATRRIGNAVDDAMNEVSSFVRSTGWEAGESARRLVGGDTAGGVAARRAWDTPADTLAEGVGDAPVIPLYGLDRNKHYVEFTFAQVRAVPVRSHDGKLIGVSFPSKRGDITAIQQWGRWRHTSANREYYPVWAVSDVATRKRRAAPRSNTPPEPAPWGDAEPIVLNAHTTGTGYRIKVKNLQTQEYDLVDVDGIVAGRLAMENKFFQGARQRHPGSPLLQVSCSPAAKGGDAHWLLARYMHGNGFTGDIWAAKDLMYTGRRGNVGAMASIAPDGSMSPPFLVTRAPR
ncbi:hypothetical protein [Nocardia australiensis]|uniref:hypothetical protein n=1 Tax=Nocardia australiensis TaxID=2887191 RepID=UPI001D147059|nr:hypothetical protein [Nocardia australiensis]